MVMEHLDGHSLADLIARDRVLPPARIAHIMEQVLSALGAAHKRGIVHRDLKPENIFIAHVEDRGDVVKLLDFGISKVLEIADPRIAGTDAGARATKHGTVMGTPLYMAPEQARGLADIDHRADLWSIGVVLYEMATGKMPFDGDNYNQILGAILDGSYRKPRAHAPALPDGLEKVISWALSQRREERPQSAQEMRAALLAACGAQTASPAAHGTPAPVRKPPSEKLDLDDIEITDGLDVKPLAGVSADDARMLAALDRLAAGGGEIELGATAGPPAPAPAAPPRAAAAATEPAGKPPTTESRAPAPPPVGASAFAPPDDTEELKLDVAVDPAPPRSSARLPALTAAPPVRPTPPPRGRGMTGIHREGGGLATMIKLVAVIAVLGAGGFALYRYLTLGYVLSPPPPRSAQVTVQVTPATAELTLDGAPLAEPRFATEVGKARRIRAFAGDRLTLEEVITPAGAEVAPLVLHLPHRLQPLVPGVLAPAADRGPAGGGAELDAALAKLARYGDCLGPLARALAASRDGYLRTSGGSERKLRASPPPEVAPIPVDVAGSCRSTLERARSEAPALAGIDDPAAALMPAVDDLAALANEVGNYYRGGKHRVDDLRWGRRKHGELVAAYERAWTAHQQLAAVVAARRAWWEERELAELKERSGEDAHWHLRRLALAAQAWLSAELAGAPAAAAGARLTELGAAFGAARDYAKAHAAELAAIEGAAAFLTAAGETVAAAGAGGRAAADQALPLHNRSIELFDAMVL
jgi:serine/threonine-protein kinase